MKCAGGIDVRSYDLSGVVDRKSLGRVRSRNGKYRKPAVVRQEPCYSAAALNIAHYLSSIVNSIRLESSAARDLDISEYTRFVKECVRYTRAIQVRSHNVAGIIDSERLRAVGTGNRDRRESSRAIQESL